jgi:hypothetical protein
MSMSNTTEQATLRAHLIGTDLPYRANASQYLALFSNNASAEADIEAGGRTYELNYTGYARIALTKASAWTDGGSAFSNAVQLVFGKRSDGGATQTAKYYAIVDTASGDFTQCISGELGAELQVSQNVQPIINIGDLLVTAQ